MATSRRKDLSGFRHGKVTWLRALERRGSNMWWEVRCDCGTLWAVSSSCKKKVKSCGCVHWEGVPDSVVKSMFYHYKESAERRGILFQLKQEELKLMSQKDCVYCGSPPQKRQYSQSQKARPVNGVDRVDNEKGYTLENCVPCCKACNFMKRNLSLTEFLEKVEKIYLNRSKYGIQNT